MSDESIFAEAVAIPDPAERAAYLDRARAGNPALRREVEELLATTLSLGGLIPDCIASWSFSPLPQGTQPGITSPDRFHAPSWNFPLMIQLVGR